MVKSYPLSIDSEFEKTKTFRFKSEGKKTIEKAIEFTFVEEENGLQIFSLGFGDVNYLGGDMVIDDMVVSNNGDEDKILATVVQSIYIFTEIESNAIVIFGGSTDVRTRYYQVKISNRLEKIQKDFLIFGLSSGEWQPFQKNVNYQQFLIQRR